MDYGYHGGLVPSSGLPINFPTEPIHHAAMIGYGGVPKWWLPPNHSFDFRISVKASSYWRCLHKLESQALVIELRWFPYVPIFPQCLSQDPLVWGSALVLYESHGRKWSQFLRKSHCRKLKHILLSNFFWMIVRYTRSKFWMYLNVCFWLAVGICQFVHGKALGSNWRSAPLDNHSMPPVSSKHFCIEQKK